MSDPINDNQYSASGGDNNNGQVERHDNTMNQNIAQNGSSHSTSQPVSASQDGNAQGQASVLAGNSNNGQTTNKGKDEDMTPANFQLGALLPKVLKVRLPSHSLNIDEDHFLRLLAGSISLSRDEKKKIIESVPKLKQNQVDELIKIFEEEKYKFSRLSAKHVPQLNKLAEQHLQDWIDLENMEQQKKQQSEDQSKADEIRKSLGL